MRLSYEFDDRDAHPDTPRSGPVDGYVLAGCGHVQISADCDDAEALAAGYAVISSVRLVA